MPVVRTPKWSDLTPDQQRSYQDEESLNMYWDSVEHDLGELRKKLSPEEFATVLAEAGIEWIDD